MYLPRGYASIVRAPYLGYSGNPRLVDLFAVRPMFWPIFHGPGEDSTAR